MFYFEMKEEDFSVLSQAALMDFKSLNDHHEHEKCLNLHTLNQLKGFHIGFII